MGAPLRSTLGFLLGVWCMLSLGAAPMPSPGGPEVDLFERVNRVRAEHHLIALGTSRELSEIARAHATDMAERGYLAHIDPKGRSPLDRVQQAGVSGFRMLAENIGASDVSGDRLDSIVQAWLESPVHRQNLLHPAFNTSGIGMARTSSGRTIAVQLFATY
jgi:uncharacterized protein YkwD